MTDLPRVMLLTDGGSRPLPEMLRLLDGAIELGVRALVVRERQRPCADRRRLFAHAAARMPDDGLVALAAPAPFDVPTHLRSRDPLPADRSAPWGRSCHSWAEVGTAADDGATWVTLSPFAESLSKPGHGPGATPLLPASACARSAAVAVYALAGIDASTIFGAMRWSGFGAAVHGAVWGAPDPLEALVAVLAAAGDGGTRTHPYDPMKE